MSDDGNGDGRLRGRWQAWTLDTNRDEVRAMFERRYGYPPAGVVRAGPILLAGPIVKTPSYSPATGRNCGKGEISRETAVCAVETPQDVLGATVRQLTLI